MAYAAGVRCASLTLLWHIRIRSQVGVLHLSFLKGRAPTWKCDRLRNKAYIGICLMKAIRIIGRYNLHDDPPGSTDR